LRVKRLREAASSVNPAASRFGVSNSMPESTRYYYDSGEKRPWKIDSERKNGTAGCRFGAYKNSKGADLDLERTLRMLLLGVLVALVLLMWLSPSVLV